MRYVLMIGYYETDAKSNVEFEQVVGIFQHWREAYGEGLIRLNRAISDDCDSMQKEPEEFSISPLYPLISESGYGMHVIGQETGTDFANIYIVKDSISDFDTNNWSS